MFLGRCVWFSNDTNFGFISSPSFVKDLFVHRTALLEPIKIDDMVQFRVSDDYKGRRCAVEVCVSNSVWVRVPTIVEVNDKKQLLTGDVGSTAQQALQRPPPVPPYSQVLLPTPPPPVPPVPAPPQYEE